MRKKHWWEDEELYQEYKRRSDVLLKEFRDKFRTRVRDAESAHIKDAEIGSDTCTCEKE
jgi:hypothetical protein